MTSTKVDALHPDALDADGLYVEGMAYYRRRQWREAKRCFEKVKALQPSRRGIDALLRELDIFLRLESIGGPEPSRADNERAPVETPLSNGASIRTVADSEEREAGSGTRWWIGLVVAIAALLLVGLVYVVLSSGWPLGGANRSQQSLRNLGQAYLIAQQYSKAVDVYSRLVQIAPDDPEALNGFQKALKGLYNEALEYEKSGNLEEALRRYRVLSEIGSGFRDVAERLETLELRAALAERYVKAREYLARQAYGDAEKELLGIRDQDPEYRPGTISDDLFEVYMGRAARSLDLAAEELQPAQQAKPAEPSYSVTDSMLSKIRAAIRDLGRALDERPTSSVAKVAAQLAANLNAGLEMYNDWAWKESIEPLALVYGVDQEYFAAKAALVLCDAYRHLGDFYQQNGEFELAVKEFQSMESIEACDQDLAATRSSQAGAPLTPTVLPTATLRPTSTRTPPPTWTPVPPTPAPSPPPSSSGGKSDGGPTSKPKPTPKPRK